MNRQVRRARKKPVEIEFMVWPGGAQNATPVINWILEHGGAARWHEEDAVLPESLHIQTLEALMQASPGDVIIRGLAGEFYPCKPGIFASSYDIISDHEEQK